MKKMTIRESFAFLLDWLIEYLNSPEIQRDKEQYNALKTFIDTYPMEQVLDNGNVITGHPATWPAWMDAVGNVIDLTISEEEAKKATYQLMKDYNEHGMGVNKAVDFIRKQLKNNT